MSQTARFAIRDRLPFCLIPLQRNAEIGIGNRGFQHQLATLGAWPNTPQSIAGENSEAPLPIGRRQGDVRSVSADGGLGLHGILLPAVPADAQDERPASDPATEIPGQPCRLGRWPQSDAAGPSGTAIRQRRSARVVTPASIERRSSCRAESPDLRSATISVSPALLTSAFPRYKLPFRSTISTPNLQRPRPL